jgi:ribosome-associated translation inhibitor RaiA
MKQQLTFIKCKDETRLRRLLEQLLRRIELQLSAVDLSEPAHLHGTVENNPAHERYRVSLVLRLPGRTLVAKEEAFEPVQAIRNAVDELQRQVASYKAFLRHEPLWRRRARREALKRERLKAG